MVIDNLNLHSKKYDRGEFRYSLLHDKDCEFKLKEKENIQILVYVMMILIMKPLIQVR